MLRTNHYKVNCWFWLKTLRAEGENQLNKLSHVLSYNGIQLDVQTFSLDFIQFQIWSNIASYCCVGGIYKSEKLLLIFGRRGRFVCTLHVYETQMIHHMIWIFSPASWHTLRKNLEAFGKKRKQLGDAMSVCLTSPLSVRVGGCCWTLILAQKQASKMRRCWEDERKLFHRLSLIVEDK